MDWKTFTPNWRRASLPAGGERSGQAPSLPSPTPVALATTAAPADAPPPQGSPVAPQAWQAALLALGWPPEVITAVAAVRDHRPPGWLAAHHPRLAEALKFGPAGYAAASVLPTLTRLLTEIHGRVIWGPEGAEVQYEQDPTLDRWLVQQASRRRWEEECAVAQAEAKAKRAAMWGERAGDTQAQATAVDSGYGM